MKFKSTIILAVVFVVLLGYVYFYEMGEEVTPEELACRIIKVDKEEIQTISILAPEEEIKLEKNDEEWMMTLPRKLRLDEEKLDELLTTVADLSSDRVVVEDKDISFADYGLDEPEYRIVVERAGGKKDTIYIGSETPVGGGYYLRKNEENKVHRLSSGKARSLMQTSDDLRNKVVVTYNFEDIQKVDVNNRGESFVLKKEDDNWEISSPYNYPAAEVDRLLDNLEQMKAKDFIDEPESLAKYDLNKPVLKFMLKSFADEKGLEVSIARPEEDGDLYVKLSNKQTVYKVPDYSFYGIDKAMNDFIDDEIFLFDDFEDVRRLVIDWKGEKIDIEPGGEEKNEEILDKEKSIVRSLNFTYADKVLGFEAMDELENSEPYMKISMEFGKDNQASQQTVEVFREKMPQEENKDKEEENEYKYYFLSKPVSSAGKEYDPLLFTVKDYDIDYFEGKLKDFVSGDGEESNNEGE